MATELQRQIGSRMQRAGRHAGLMQKEIADRLGVEQSAVSRWFKGTNAPDADTMERFAEVVGADAGWLWTGNRPLTIANLAEGTVECLVGCMRGKSLRQSFQEMMERSGDGDTYHVSPGRIQTLDIGEDYVREKLTRLVPDWERLSDDELGEKIRSILAVGL